MQKLAIPIPNLDHEIFLIRGHRVMLDTTLARIYEIPTFHFNQAVKRNRNRFPSDFMFQLTREEFASLTSQFVMSKKGRGGRRTIPYAFTDYGSLMAANILNSERAIEMSIYVVRAFMRMREELVGNLIMKKRLTEIEKTLLSHDSALRDLYAKIKPLLLPPPVTPKPPIGFKIKPRN